MQPSRAIGIQYYPREVEYQNEFQLELIPKLKAKVISLASTELNIALISQPRTRQKFDNHRCAGQMQNVVWTFDTMLLQANVESPTSGGTAGAPEWPACQAGASANRESNSHVLNYHQEPLVLSDFQSELLLKLLLSLKFLSIQFAERASPFRLVPSVNSHASGTYRVDSVTFSDIQYFLVESPHTLTPPTSSVFEVSLPEPECCRLYALQHNCKPRPVTLQYTRCSLSELVQEAN
ncbi:hypothetical protein C8J57DRAFT_1252656 [Mycena rebaudengoi]|nr:hypothetical protein C8J57DRAFT_1252656 [Mycena rebaudengoi]